MVSALGIVVLPLQRLRGLVVLTDVAHELLVQVLERGENAAADDVALDAREPVLDLVEPRRVGGRVVNPHVRVFGQEGLDQLGLVAADVIADDVDLAALRLSADNVADEADELLAGVARSGHAQDFAGGGVQGGEQAEVPLRLYSNPWLSARPGASGSMRSLPSSAWITVFSSTHNTAACDGGFRYRPITSAALVSKSGSL